MSDTASQPRIVPFGSRAFLVYFNREQDAVCFAHSVRSRAGDWLEDVVPAYASVGVFFDPEKIARDQIHALLKSLDNGAVPPTEPTPHLIPCCYEMQQDMERVRSATGLSADEIIRLHTSVEYTVFAVGFCPGFPFLGYLPEALQGVPRLPSPRLRVEPGSVGLTGKQTGLYPLERPGGWNLIGRTPLVVVDVEANFFPIRVGDRVRFDRIDEAEFRRVQGNRLRSEVTPVVAASPPASLPR